MSMLIVWDCLVVGRKSSEVKMWYGTNERILLVQPPLCWSTFARRFRFHLRSPVLDGCITDCHRIIRQYMSLA